MPTGDTGRKHISELLKGYSKFQDEFAINYHLATVDVEGSGSVDNIGLILRWSESDSAFIPFTVNADWAASTAYVVGDVVKPATQDGLEYVCIVAGTSNDTEGEQFIAVEGATTTETDGVVWLARRPYGPDVNSPLPNKASVCVAVGSHQGLGFNKAATTLSGTAVKMTALFRGQAGLVAEYLEGYSALAADDKAELKAALERMDIAIVDAAEVPDPSYV